MEECQWRKVADGIMEKKDMNRAMKDEIVNVMQMARTKQMPQERAVMDKRHH